MTALIVITGFVILASWNVVLTTAWLQQRRVLDCLDDVLVEHDKELAAHDEDLDQLTGRPS